MREREERTQRELREKMEAIVSFIFQYGSGNPPLLLCFTDRSGQPWYSVGGETTQGYGSQEAGSLKAILEVGYQISPPP